MPAKENTNAVALWSVAKRTPINILSEFSHIKNTYFSFVFHQNIPYSSECQRFDDVSWIR